jgi:hypothetical protein
VASKIEDFRSQRVTGLAASEIEDFRSQKIKGRAPPDQESWEEIGLTYCRVK